MPKWTMRESQINIIFVQESMALPLSHEEICDFFERCNEPFIFPYKQKGEISLENYVPSPRNRDGVDRALCSITDSLVHLRLNMIMPCQIKFSYVILSKQWWGLKHVICYCNSQQNIGEDAYNPEEEQYHHKAEHELMWNIGKIMLRFFTDANIRIKFDSQQKIDRLIQQYVSGEEIKSLIKRLLVWDHRERISFEQFLLHEFFCNRQGKNPYQLSIKHLRTLHSIEIDFNRPRLNALNLYSPFVKEIRNRCFLEYLEVDYYFEYVGSEITAFFAKSSQDTAECQLTVFIIALHSYFTMTQLSKEKILMGDMGQTLQQRLYYSKLVKRAVKVRDYLEKTARRLKDSYSYDNKVIPFLKNLDLLQPQSVYDQFKNRLRKYAEVLRSLSQNTAMLRLLVHVYILRTSRYIFTEMRNEVFAPFLANSPFKIRQVLLSIINCKDPRLLNEMLLNLKEFYLK